MALPEKVVEGLVAGSFGIVGTLVTAAVAWVRDRDVTTQRVHQLEEATKRLQFWDQWVKLATDLPLPMDEVCMGAVQREMNMLLRLLETTSHSLESALTLQRSQTTALSEMVHGLSPLRRALLLYSPARPLAWFPRGFYYICIALALVFLLALADPAHGASVKEVFLVELFLVTAAVIFRSLSEWLEKPRLVHSPPPLRVPPPPVPPRAATSVQ